MLIDNYIVIICLILLIYIVYKTLKILKLFNKSKKIMTVDLNAILGKRKS